MDRSKGSKSNERKRAINMVDRLDRDALLRLAWQHGHSYPPRTSSRELVRFLSQRGVGTTKGAA